MSYDADIAHIRRVLDTDPHNDTDQDVAELRTAVEYLVELVERLIAERPSAAAELLAIDPTTTG